MTNVHRSDQEKNNYARRAMHLMERESCTQKDAADILGVPRSSLGQWIQAYKESINNDPVEIKVRYTGCCVCDSVEDGVYAMQSKRLYCKECFTIKRKLSNIPPDILHKLTGTDN